MLIERWAVRKAKWAVRKAKWAVRKAKWARRDFRAESYLHFRKIYFELAA